MILNSDKIYLAHIYFFSNSNIHQQVIRANTNYDKINGLFDIIFSNISNVLFMCLNETFTVYYLTSDLVKQAGIIILILQAGSLNLRGFHRGHQEGKGLLSPNPVPSIPHWFTLTTRVPVSGKLEIFVCFLFPF